MRSLKGGSSSPAGRGLSSREAASLLKGIGVAIAAERGPPQ